MRVREALARSSAIRVIIPVLLLVPILGIAIIWVVRSGCCPYGEWRPKFSSVMRTVLAPVDTTHLPLEVAPLAQELNRLLARLDSAFIAQRAFIADAAHELRSPLTAVRLQLQLLDPRA